MRRKLFYIHILFTLKLRAVANATCFIFRLRTANSLYILASLAGARSVGTLTWRNTCELRGLIVASSLFYLRIKPLKLEVYSYHVWCSAVLAHDVSSYVYEYVTYTSISVCCCIYFARACCNREN